MVSTQSERRHGRRESMLGVATWEAGGRGEGGRTSSLIFARPFEIVMSRDSLPKPASPPLTAREPAARQRARPGQLAVSASRRACAGGRETGVSFGTELGGRRTCGADELADHGGLPRAGVGEGDLRDDRVLLEHLPRRAVPGGVGGGAVQRRATEDRRRRRCSGCAPDRRPCTRPSRARRHAQCRCCRTGTASCRYSCGDSWRAAALDRCCPCSLSATAAGTAPPSLPIGAFLSVSQPTADIAP
jgi:hypothetical protein